MKKTSIHLIAFAVFVLFSLDRAEAGERSYEELRHMQDVCLSQVELDIQTQVWKTTGNQIGVNTDLGTNSYMSIQIGTWTGNTFDSKASYKAFALPKLTSNLVNRRTYDGLANTVDHFVFTDIKVNSQSLINESNDQENKDIRIDLTWYLGCLNKIANP